MVVLPAAPRTISMATKRAFRTATVLLHKLCNEHGPCLAQEPLTKQMQVEGAYFLCGSLQPF
jgi:hypothetical protein